MNSPREGRNDPRPAVPSDVEPRSTDGPADLRSGARSALEDFFDWCRKPRRDASARPEFALLLFIISIALIFVTIWSAGPLSGEQSAPDLSLAVPPPSDGHSAPDLSLADPPSDGLSAPDPSAHQKRLASKAAYRARRSADPAFRESESQRSREWRREHPDKARAQKKKARAANYHRPFVAIDSEGQDYLGDDIWYDGVRYPRHDTYLWGAAADDGRSPVWLVAAETHGVDKRPLSAVEILDWLLDLPRQYDGKAVFVMFSFKYDIAQILKHFDYYRAWEILKRETYPDKNGVVRQIGHAPVFWKGYAITYIDGKSFDIWRLADPDKPYQNGRLKSSAHIRIYDVFGFFQSGFSAVADSMVKSSLATREEADFLAAMKRKREEFSTVPIEEIKNTRRSNCAS